MVVILTIIVSMLVMLVLIIIMAATPRTIAQRFIAWRLGIPSNYLQKCPPDLQAEQMQYWLQHEKNDQLFFRFDGSNVRAIFTPKYKPVDNFEVIERLDSMGYKADTPVQCRLDGEFMSLSIIDGKRAFDINGDRFRPGLSVSNSEVGLSSLSIAAFVLRLICTNGMVSKTQVAASYWHVSSKILTEMPQVLEKVSMELGKQNWDQVLHSYILDPREDAILYRDAMKVLMQNLTPISLRTGRAFEKDCPGGTFENVLGC